MIRKLLRLLPALSLSTSLLLLGLSSCATQSDRSWIGPNIGRVGVAAEAPAVPEPSGAATR